MNTKTIGAIVVVGILVGGSYFFTNNKEVEMNDGPMAGYPCHQMGGQWMGNCKFDKDGNPIFEDSKKSVHKGEMFSESTEGLPELLPTKVVKLNDGDVYEMTAGLVKQEVGNRVIKRLAYNGMIPGPILEVAKDAEITLRFKNELDVETTLHSHGLRGEDLYDGVPTGMGGKQKAMKPGDTFDYKLNFKDVGVFWYHPHIREDYGQELGLYGNFHVTEDGYWNDVNREEFLVLDDFSQDNPFYKDITTQTLMGRFGDILMINNNEDYSLRVKKDETVRFYITNTANTRTFDVKIDGVPMKLVGGDTGRIEKEVLTDNIVISPSERWVLESKFEKSGTFEITHRGEKIGQIVVEDEEVEVEKDFSVMRKNLADYTQLRGVIEQKTGQPADKKLTIDIKMPGMNMAGMVMDMGGMDMDDVDHGEDGIEWEDEMAVMNQLSTDKTVEWVLRDSVTGKENMNIDWKFKQNDFIKIEIYNDPESMHPMQHPIHFHGQKFAVISRDGVAVDNLQWEDTTLIPTGEKIEIILNTTNVGTWMTHCHIAEHLSAGMMFNFTVKE